MRREKGFGRAMVGDPGGGRGGVRGMGRGATYVWVSGAMTYALHGGSDAWGSAMHEKQPGTRSIKMLSTRKQEMLLQDITRIQQECLGVSWLEKAVLSGV